VFGRSTEDIIMAQKHVLRPGMANVARIERFPGGSAPNVAGAAVRFVTMFGLLALPVVTTTDLRFSKS
jgi:hypothetical protein